MMDCGDRGRVGFHISWGSFSIGWTSEGMKRLLMVEAVVGIVMCQLSLTGKVTKDRRREDILRIEMDERRCWRRRSQ